MTFRDLHVDIARQRLVVRSAGRVEAEYAVSTSKFGVGEKLGSYMTPRGRHIVRAKIGADCAAGTVFVGRRPTGEIYSEELGRAFPDRDWILSRILWLSGREKGRNRLGVVDTMRRHIYIHGMPDSDPVGVPGSIGCIRMRNRDVIELFDSVACGTIVTIA